jgi:hypothetical protein
MDDRRRPDDSATASGTGGLGTGGLEGGNPAGEVEPGFDLGPTAAPMENQLAKSPAPYKVLARKYRPSSFDDLIGQDAMVRTVSNAFETGRIPQAWILTGVRGVGKTTTARILARALNYQLQAGRLDQRPDHRHAGDGRALPGDHRKPPYRCPSKWTPPRITASMMCGRSTTRRAMRR